MPWKGAAPPLSLFDRPPSPSSRFRYVMFATHLLGLHRHGTPHPVHGPLRRDACKTRQSIQSAHLSACGPLSRFLPACPTCRATRWLQAEYLLIASLPLDKTRPTTQHSPSATVSAAVSAASPPPTVEPAHCRIPPATRHPPTVVSAEEGLPNTSLHVAQGTCPSLDMMMKSTARVRG